jgi:hypothetical protein
VKDKSGQKKPLTYSHKEGAETHHRADYPSDVSKKSNTKHSNNYSYSSPFVGYLFPSFSERKHSISLN